jgi:hypothetical protein
MLRKLGYAVIGISTIALSFSITTLALNAWERYWLADSNITGSIASATGIARLISGPETRAGDQVRAIVTGFKSIYGTKPLDLGNWATDITGVAIKDHFMPADMLPPSVNCPGGESSESCYGLGPWSGSTVKVFSGQQYNAIGVIYSKLDSTACSQLANAFVASTTGLVIMNINRNGYSFPPYGNSAYPTSSDIITACSNGKANQVQFLYAMK